MTSSDEQALGVFEREILRTIYGPFCDRGECCIRRNQELYDIYAEIDVVKHIMSFVWIAPTQFVTPSNLCLVVEVAENDGPPSVGANRLMRI